MKCKNCKINERQVKKIKGKIYTLKNCRTCDRIKYEKPYLSFRKDYCEFCGFIPVNMCQLDVDHIDGNHKNNNKNNLQTLCSNCHRLKTFLQLHSSQ